MVPSTLYRAWSAIVAVMYRPLCVTSVFGVWLVSGNSLTVSCSVGSSPCKPTSQGGEPWKSWPIGLQARTRPGACVACSRQLIGIAICWWRGGCRKPSTPLVIKRDVDDPTCRWGCVFVIARTWKTIADKAIKALVTHLDEWCPRQVVGAYQRRWPVAQI